MQYPLAAESGLAARMSERFSQVIVTLRYPDLKCLGAPNAHYRSATQGAEFHTHITSLSLQSGRKGADISHQSGAIRGIEFLRDRRTTMKMLILRGKAGFYDGKNWPRGALYEQPALDYASRRGYEGQVLDIAGVAYTGSPQHRMALAEYRRDRTITALYGFSAGGYNVRHIIDDMTKDERDRFAMAVVLGAPGNSPSLYKGPWELVYRLDPATGHMDGPRALLAEWDAAVAP